MRHTSADAALAAVASADRPELGDLPNWDLNDLYRGTDSPELKADLERMEREARAFGERLRGKVAEQDGAALGAAIAEYEAMDEVLGRIMSFAYLVYAGDMSAPENGRFLQTMQEKVTNISTHLLFFTLEINRIDEAALEGKLEAPALARYAPWLRDVRSFRPHQLSDELERLLHEKSVAGRQLVHFFNIERHLVQNLTCDQSIAGPIIKVLWVLRN